jgi:hypothetical protein
MDRKRSERKEGRKVFKDGEGVCVAAADGSPSPQGKVLAKKQRHTRSRSWAEVV